MNDANDALAHFDVVHGLTCVGTTPGATFIVATWERLHDHFLNYLSETHGSLGN